MRRLILCRLRLSKTRALARKAAPRGLAKRMRYPGSLVCSVI